MGGLIQSPYGELSGLLVTRDSKGVVIATLNRPERLNAFDGGLRYSLRHFIDRATRDEDARAVMLTGAGRAFSSGADLGAEDKRGWPTGLSEPAFAWCSDLLQMPKPTVAAINGVAAGGGLGLSLLCDLRICADDARLIPVWNRRGIHPDDLVTWTLPKLVGYSRALYWLYRASDIPLEEAVSTGLILECVPNKHLHSRATQLTEELAAGPTTQLALTKNAVLKGLISTPIDSALLESWGQDRTSMTSDRVEGVKAFLEKRPPQFTGR